jgi:hypothetical protein
MALLNAPIKICNIFENYEEIGIKQNLKSRAGSKGHQQHFGWFFPYSFDRF